MNIAKHYINGQWVETVSATAASMRENSNPATGETVATFCDGGVPEAQAAVAAARATFDNTSWSHNARLRAQLLLNFADRLEQRKEVIADWLVTLNGKLRREAMGEIMAGVSELKYYAGVARNLFGRTVEIEPDCYSLLDREAAGVAAIILPWNAPVTLLVRSLAPALAAGCTAVIKPAHQTALVNNLVLECLFEEDSLPVGVVNSVIESGSAISQYLCEADEVDVISFTGSSRVGKLIARAASGTLKRLSLELGGKVPAIVFDDCDLDKTVTGIVSGSMVMAGQQCTGVERVLVSGTLYDELAGRLVEALKTLRVGPGNNPQSQMGCLIDSTSRNRVAALVEEADRAGQVLHRGAIPAGSLANGAFLEPSLLAVDDLSSPLIQEEIFGPVLVLERFHDEADAIRRANATRYGLAASVWSRDVARGRRVAARLRFGTVWLNAHNRLFAEIETGGSRDSGYGKLHGLEAMHDFMHTKHFYFETR